MENIKNKLSELKSLADEWMDFSYKSNGWEYKEYGNEKIEVKCYFAVGSDHKSLTFCHRILNSNYFYDNVKIKIAYFNPCVFNDITLKALDYIDEIIKNARELLNFKKLEQNKVSEERIEMEKKNKILALKKELERLEK